MPANREYVPGQIFRTVPPKVRANLLCRALISLLPIPFLLALTLAGEARAPAGTKTSTSNAVSVSVDAEGNLVVNGAPFLLIQGTNTDYGWWYAAGYSRAQADAKMAQMVQNGFNTNFTAWATMDNFWPGGDATLYQDVLMWNLHGLYQHGGAALDDRTEGVPADYGIWNNPEIVRIMNRFKSRPNLLLWWIDGEYNHSDTSATRYCTGATTVRELDSTRLWGDVAVNSMSAAEWEQILGRCMPVAWLEGVIARAGHGTGEAFINLHDGLIALNQAWNDGYRFVLGVSTTPIEELDPSAVGDTRSCTDHYHAMRIPTAAEIHRYYMYQVANNVRAFDMLWAPNQRCSTLPQGDHLSPAYVAAWNNTMKEMSRIKSLAPVILAPGRWQPLGTAPSFAPYAPSPTNNDFKGIYAAKKTFAGKTYVVACNVDFHEDARAVNNWTEHAIPNATINVGQRITSLKRLFENAPAPRFSGGVITDSFAPMGVHVYVMTF